MPTSHGSLLFKGAAAGRRTTRSTSAACGRPARCRSARRRAPEFGTLHFTKTKALGHHPQPVGPGAHARAARAAVRPPRWPPAWCRSPRPATAAARPASRPAFSGLVGIKASFGRIPQPGADRVADRGARRAHHHGRRRGPPPRRRRRARRPRPHVAAAARRRPTSDAIERSTWPACAPAGRPTSGFAVVDPEVREPGPGAAEALVAGRGPGASTTSPCTLTDPVRTWLCGRRGRPVARARRTGMWPGVADDLTAYSRARCLERTADMTVPTLRPLAASARAQLEADVAALFAEVDVLLTPTTAVAGLRRRGPAARRRSPATRCVGRPCRVPFTMLANLCWNPSISVPAGLTSDGLPVGPADHRPPARRRRRPAPGPPLRAGPPLAPLRPTTVLAGVTWTGMGVGAAATVELWKSVAR